MSTIKSTFPRKLRYHGFKIGWKQTRGHLSKLKVKFTNLPSWMLRVYHLFITPHQLSNFACNNNSVQKSVIKPSKFPFIFPVRGSALPFEKVEQVTGMFFFRETRKWWFAGLIWARCRTHCFIQLVGFWTPISNLTQEMEIFTTKTAKRMLKSQKAFYLTDCGWEDFLNVKLF